MDRDERIFVAGHRGMVGSAIRRQLERGGFRNIVTREREELDLRDAGPVAAFFRRERPATVILAAARVGGIMANMRHPAEFLYDNLMIQANVVHQAYLHGTTRFCFLGSSCIYPRECPQPMREEHLLGGPLEPTNEAYALAKLAGIKMLEYYGRQYGFASVCPLPCNLYGTNDSYDPENSHVLSALVRKFADAVDDGSDPVVVWGTGAARREFMHVDDLARAVLFLMEAPGSPGLINVGTGRDVTVRELAGLVAKTVGYRGRIEWDASRPDGMPRKCLDVSRLEALGFRAGIGLEEGIARTVSEYRDIKRAGAGRPGTGEGARP